MLNNSIKYKIIFTISIIILPFIVIVNYSNIYHLGLIRHQIAQASVGTTSLYIDEVDKSIHEIESYLYKLSSVNEGSIDENVFGLGSSDEHTRIFSNLNLSRQIRNDISLYNLISFLFVYTESFDNLLYAYSDDTTYNERQELANYVKTRLVDENYDEKRNWFIITVNGQNYLLRVVRRDGIYMGSFINFNKIAKPLNSVNNEFNGSFIFSDSNGNSLTNVQFVNDNALNLKGDFNTYYLSGKTKKYVITGGKSKAGDFRLLMAIPDINILEGLNTIQYFILTISILAVFILPFLLWVIYLWVLKPMGNLKTAIGRVEKGELDYKIIDGKASEEFLELYYAFNSMTGQIKNLKINVYEKIIEKQKLELRYYQTQIKPHFLMNALTTVSNFAQMGKYQSMYEFIHCLSNYIRYMFKNNLILIPLKEEIEHINNYLSMQELRSPEYLSHTLDIDARMEEVMIPPFIIHTFIENVIKHAITFDRIINIFIRVEPIELDGEAFVRIMIEDDGKGMTREEIKQVNDEPKDKEDGKSIGIWNVKQTLKLLYSDRAKVVVENSDLSGVMVEIVIPVER